MTFNKTFITEMATGFPGATGVIPNSVAPVAEMLRLNGYPTAENDILGIRGQVDS